ncbi:MAG: hypothetical protein LBP63_05500 [Prevotellaceae bacterium]|jgi:hypothetical protein|nr:hypothetical protein [Prevotellaceae bacterium]
MKANRTRTTVIRRYEDVRYENEIVNIKPFILSIIENYSNLQGVISDFKCSIKDCNDGICNIINNEHFKNDDDSKNDFIELVKVIGILLDLSRALDNETDNVHYYTDLNKIKRRLENETKDDAKSE